MTATPLLPTEPPASIPASPSGTCQPGTGPTEHSAGVTSPETWTAAESPHVISADITISAELTFEPCAEIRIAAGRSLWVAATGSLIANGDEAHHIVITGNEPPVPFGTIRAAGGGTMHLAYVDISGGGDPSNTNPSMAGTIYVQGVDASQPTQPILFTDHVSITGSASDGVLVRDGAGFVPGSTALRVTESAVWPVAIWARAAGTLPDGSYVGNSQDVITLLDGDSAGAIAESTTLPDPGVPYLVGGEFSSGGLRVVAPVGATDTVVLTLQPGVKLLFRPLGILEVEHYTGDTPAFSALIAEGTPDNPIVFSSAAETPAAGDWYGLRYGLIPSNLNKLDYVGIEYAGAGSPAQGARCRPATRTYTNGAALQINGRPTNEFLTNSTISFSAGHGVARLWLGKRVDFTPTNTFDQIAGCTQT